MCWSKSRPYGEIWCYGFSYSIRGNPCRIPRTFIRPFLERFNCILNFPRWSWYGDSFRSRIDRCHPIEPYPDGGRILPNAIATIVKSTIFISSRSDTNQFSWNWYRIRNSFSIYIIKLSLERALVALMRKQFGQHVVIHESLLR